MSPRRVILGLTAANIEEAIASAIGAVPQAELPFPSAQITKSVLERERAMSTYLGDGIAIPHARLEGLEQSVLILARSEEGIPVKGRDERAKFLFILLTPAGSPRTQVRLLSRIAGLIESAYVRERIEDAKSGQAIADAIRSAETISLSRH
ncbi:MAG: hypothetical protein A2Z34_07405 [Planctomycetes bacterium RBG_16_59_8]|nr:MAG: hypothetical protein A2Z34_07405 [Planctomycetes bacterium RBG_16_59_8]